MDIFGTISSSNDAIDFFSNMCFAINESIEYNRQAKTTYEVGGNQIMYNLDNI